MIIWNGIEFRSKGIIVEKTPTISKAKKKINVYEIDGRNGFLSVDTGKYESFLVEVECHFHESANKDEIKAFLDGYGTLSFDGKREYTAIIQNAISFEKVMHFKRFIVQFLVNPICEDIEESYNIISTEIQTITGNNISLFNSNVKNIELLGDTEQQSYSGKNLLKNTNINSGDNNYWSNYTTYDQETGTLTKSITATTYQYILHNYNLKNNTKYTISCLAKSNGYVKSFNIFAYNKNVTAVYEFGKKQLTNQFQKFSFTFTTDSNTDFTKANLRFDNNGSTESGTAAILTIKDVMLVEGEDNEFEPYVGETPSPNPDYPQKINNVTGRQLIDVVGKNLFNYNDFFDNYVKPANVNTGRYAIKLKPNETYTISTNFEKSSTTAEVFVISGNNTSFVPTSNNNGVFVNAPRTITSDDDGYITIAMYVAGTDAQNKSNFENGTSKIQIEQGAIATEYEEYKGQSYEINLVGKNLLNPKKIINGYGLNSNAATTYVQDTRSYFDYIEIDEQTTYTISNLNWKVIQFLDSSKGYISGTNDTSSNTFITPSNARFFRISFDNTLDYSQAQIEKGSSTTSYSEYSPIELCNINNNRDRIRKSTGKNLFDKDNIIEGKYINADGIEIIDSNNFIGDYIQIDSTKQYYVSGTQGSVRIAYYDSSQTFISRQMITSASGLLTIPNNTKKLRLSSYNIALNTLQLELGNQATDLEPYGVGKWYIYNLISKYTFKGSSSDTYNFNSDNTNTLAININPNGVSNSFVKIENVYSLYCDKFTYEHNVNDKEHVYITGAYNVGNNFRLYIDKSRLSGYSSSLTEAQKIELVKTWLSNNNVEVEYLLATPTIEEITSTNYPELYNQLIELDNMYTYDGVSNIMSTLELELEYIPKYQELAIEGGNYTIYPVLEITSVGDISITINNQTFYLYNTNGTYILDSKNQVITKDGINESSSMLGNFPTLENIANKVSYTGNVSSFKVIYKKSYL